MARYIGPRQKLQRAFGEDLSLKTNAVKTARRLAILPGQHGAKGRKKLSDYGEQLREKQKVRVTYGVMEKQMHHYYEIATKTPASTGAALLKLLERRLDNAVFRLGLAPTRAAARQMVAHHNVIVNGKRLSIPSYQINIGDVISITDKATKIPAVASILEDKNRSVPAWLEKKVNTGKVVRFPERNEIDLNVNEQLIVEFYSR